MRKNNDQVFPTSLSEIAFTLVFMLILLLGYMFLTEQKQRLVLQRKLDNVVGQTESHIAANHALEKARIQFEKEMAAAGHPSPDSITTKLVEASNIQVERERLQKEMQDLKERLSALSVLWEKIEKAGIGRTDKIAREEIERTLELKEDVRKLAANQSELGTPPETRQMLERVKDAVAAIKTLKQEAKSQLGMDVNPGQESAVVRSLIDGAPKPSGINRESRSAGTLIAENEKLRGQIQYFTNRGDLRGLDHPPCWTDANGKIEFLFKVETRPDGFNTTKAWPINREQDALSLPNIEQALVSGPSKVAGFSAVMQPILDWSKAQNPECRHFVYLSTTVVDADARDNARKVVEGFFYKLEVKR